MCVPLVNKWEHVIPTLSLGKVKLSWSLTSQERRTRSRILTKCHQSVSPTSHHELGHFNVMWLDLWMPDYSLSYVHKMGWENQSNPIIVLRDNIPNARFDDRITQHLAVSNRNTIMGSYTGCSSLSWHDRVSTFLYQVSFQCFSSSVYLPWTLDC